MDRQARMLAGGLAGVLCFCGPAAFGADPEPSGQADQPGQPGAGEEHGADIPDKETVYYDGPAGPDGVLTGGRIRLPMPEVTRRRLAREAVTLDNRVDLVFVGDGYTASEQGLFHAHAASVQDQLFSYEPYTTYEPYFRLHEIEVVSNESGVDNDPTRGVMRDTALDMAFWCNDIERLLCVSVPAAWNAASAAPDVDQIIAVANSTKYGGAGYASSDVGTVSGGNGAAPDIAIHELGHSLANLADEYTYGGPTTYNGPEPPDANASIYEAGQMADLGTKWAAWLGDSDPRFDGPVSTFEGAIYSEFGVYRPSDNSMMRSLGRPFNAPSAEAIIGEIYAEVTPLADHTPNGDEVASDQTLEVTPLEPLGHSLDVSWSLDGEGIPGASGASLDLAALGLDGPATVSATVMDNTDMVRDEAMRQARMTASVSWSVVPAGDPCPADLTGPGGEPDGAVTSADFLAFIDLFAAGDAAADFDGSGTVTSADFLAFIDAFAQGCP